MEILGAALEMELQSIQTLSLALNDIPEMDLALQPGGIVIIPTTESPVTSVNSKVGNVQLSASDVGALSSDTVIPVVPQAEIDANTASRHTHNNKAVLDEISSSVVESWDGKRDAHENLVDTLHPTYYYKNCHGTGNAINVDVLSGDATRFRINLVEPLKAGQEYTFSFHASNCGSTTPSFYLQYATSVDPSATLTQSTFSFTNGTRKISFTPSADGIYPRILMTNSGLTRTDRSGVILDNFKIEKGGSRTAYIPSEQAIANQAQLDKWRHVQKRIYDEAVNQWPLYFVSGKTEIDSTAAVNEYSSYQPFAVYSWARKELSVIANFKASATISDGDTIFTGLPPVESSVKIYNALSWVNNGKLCSASAVYTTANYESVSSLPGTVTNGKVVRKISTGQFYTGIGGEWVLRYTPCGVLKFESDGSGASTIPSGTSVRFESRPIPMATPYGAHRFPKLSATDVHNAAQWMISARGKYDYSNNGRWRRKIYSDSGQPFSGYGATDCAGIVHQAFRYGAGKFVPDGTKSQLGFGKVIAFARNNEYLDLSNLQEGDLVGYIYPDDDGKIWAVMHVAMAVDEGANGVHLWNVSDTYGTEYFDDYKHGMIADGKDKPLGSEGNNITFGPQPVRGTYESVSQAGVYIYRDDSEKSFFNARIVVRWLDDYAELDSAY